MINNILPQIMLRLSSLRRDFKNHNISSEKLDEELKKIIDILGELTERYGDSFPLNEAKTKVWSTIETLCGIEELSDSIYNRSNSLLRNDSTLTENQEYVNQYYGS